MLKSFSYVFMSSRFLRVKFFGTATPKAEHFESGGEQKHALRVFSSQNENNKLTIRIYQYKNLSKQKRTSKLVWKVWFEAIWKPHLAQLN